jgi:hypothetical protein
MTQCNAGEFSALHDIALRHRNEFSFFFFFVTVFSDDYALYSQLSIPDCVTHFSLPSLVHTRSGVHPALFPVGAGDSFLERVGQARPSTAVKTAWSYTSTSHSP